MFFFSFKVNYEKKNRRTSRAKFTHKGKIFPTWIITDFFIKLF